MPVGRPGIPLAVPDFYSLLQFGLGNKSDGTKKPRQKAKSFQRGSSSLLCADAQLREDWLL